MNNNNALITLTEDDVFTPKRSRGRPSGTSKKNLTYVPSLVDFSEVSTLKNLNIDLRMLETMTSGLPIDELISYENGVPRATNIMVIGDPGVGKTTVMLDLLSGLQHNGAKCLFISGEMGRKQMYKYTQRFPQFNNLTTIFLRDYLNHNTKDVIEQILTQGWDCVLIDSAAEVLDGVRDDNGWDRKTAESWLVDVCSQMNDGLNDDGKFTSFLVIQQVTKGGVFVGSNKLKHLMDALMEMRKESEKNGGGNYMRFEKNRNGLADIRSSYTLGTDKIIYSKPTIVIETEEVETE